MFSLKPIGMQVKVTDGIKGLVPSMHLADVTLKQPEKKYSIGREVRCRVRAARQGLQLLLHSCTENSAAGLVRQW